MFRSRMGKQARVRLMGLPSVLTRKRRREEVHAFKAGEFRLNEQTTSQFRTGSWISFNPAPYDLLRHAPNCFGGSTIKDWALLLFFPSHSRSSFSSLSPPLSTKNQDLFNEHITAQWLVVPLHLVEALARPRQGPNGLEFL
jgi:hypothetical protein